MAKFALLTVLLIEHLAFGILFVWLHPTESAFVIIFVAWTSLPAFTGAIATSNTRYFGVVPASNGLVAGCLIYWLLAKQLVGEPSEMTVGDSVAFPLAGLVIGTLFGAFVHIIRRRLDSCHETGRRNRVLIGAKKGIAFATLCVLVSIPVLLVLLPPTHSGKLSHDEQASRKRNTASAIFWYSTTGLFTGLAVGTLVGTTYKPLMQTKA